MKHFEDKCDLKISFFRRTNIYQTKVRGLWKPSPLLSVQLLDPNAFKVKWWQQVLRKKKRRKVFLLVGSMEWKTTLATTQGLPAAYSFSHCQQMLTLRKRHSEQYRAMQKMEHSWFFSLYNSLHIFYSSTCPGTKPPKHLLYQFISLLFLWISTNQYLQHICLHYLSNFPTDVLLVITDIMPTTSFFTQFPNSLSEIKQK